MTIIEHTPTEAEILDFLNDGIRQLQEAGAEARYLLLGPVAYERFRQAMAVRFHRKPKNFELYNHLPIVLDPFRGEAACVVPSPGECALGVATYRVDT